MWILNLVSWILFSVQRELKRFLWCGQIRFRHLPSTVNKSTMLGHGLARADSENIVTNYRLFQRVNVTREFHRVNIQVPYYGLFLFINNSFIKIIIIRKCEEPLFNMQQCVVSDILIFLYFSIHSLHLGYIVWSNARYIWAETKIFQESIFARN